MIIYSDLSEVLIRGICGMEQWVATFYKDADKDIAEKFWRRHLETNDEFCDAMRGEFGDREYWKILLANSGLPCTAEMLHYLFLVNIGIEVRGTADVYRNIVSCPANFRPNAEREQGCPPIYLVSDHLPGCPEHILGLHPWLKELTEKQFWSCDRGHIKQDPGFFDELLRENGHQPDEVIFIDDNPSNVATAARAGIRGIIFQNPSQLYTVLTCGFGFEFSGAWTPKCDKASRP